MIKIHHNGMVVESIEDSKELFESFGFLTISRFEKDKPKMRAYKLRKNDQVIEIFRFEDENDPEVQIMKKHIGLLSDDFENDLDILLRNGFQVVISETKGTTVKRFLFLKDEKDNYFELFEE